MQSCFETGRWYRKRVIKMIKLHTFLVHVLPFKVAVAAVASHTCRLTIQLICLFVKCREVKCLPKMYTTENEKWHATGQSQNSIARHFGKSKSVISQLVSWYRQTGGVKIRDGRGWLKKTTPRQDRYLRIFALRNRFISAPEWRDTFRGAMGNRLSKSTIHNRLREVGA